jgi:putative addiction module CopG family antidote
MRATRQYTITFSDEMADFVESKVQSEHYSSVNEVLRDGVRALMEREVIFEKWLREEAVASMEEYEADPGRGVPIDEVMDRILKRANDRAVARNK